MNLAGASRVTAGRSTVELRAKGMIGAGGNAPLVDFPNYLVTVVLQTTDGNGACRIMVPGAGIEPAKPGV